MAKVLRLHKGAADTISHWDSSSKIGTTAINSIVDSNESDDKHEITSIPSPFARMDLVKRAFKIVADSGKLDGTTPYHKLVSDCLDVGQIFFNIEKYRDMIEVIEWDTKNNIEELRNSYSDEHNRLGRTYEIFLEQDGDEYNFDKNTSIYLLNFTDPSAPGMMNIIGATSPATIFFTSANDLTYVGQKIKFGNDCPFDSEYKPLYKRDPEYIKYWWALLNSRQDFAKIFKEVYEYLKKCYNKISDENIKRELKQIESSTEYYKSNYDEISVGSSAQQYVNILGDKLRGKRAITNVSSGFEMKISNSLQNGNVPLVLPAGQYCYSEPTHYVVDKWDKNTYVPYFDPRPINERTLPDDGTKYPYVTVGDFLEDTIVKVGYEFNSEAFFDGNYISKDNKHSFILPLKKTFFDYFTVQDLYEKISGKNRIEVVAIEGNSVKVILRIPIKDGGFIEYEKIYYPRENADASSNKGAIIGENDGKEFTLGLYPNIKYGDLAKKIKPFYRVALVDRDTVFNQNSSYKLSFYDNSNSEVAVESVVRRNRNVDDSRFDETFADYSTYALESEFQYIALSDENDRNIHGVIIPKFATRTGGRKFRFAIDFGTTNTHIEYSIDGAQYSNAFEITQKDMQIQKMHITDDTFVNNIFNSDFIPTTIGGDSLYGYPMRTVMSESNNTNWDKPVVPMANVNIPFTYEKNKVLTYNDIHTDLKWSTDNIGQERAKKYIESILLMLRNKVLLNNGDLSKTEIVWFYPASMTTSRLKHFNNAWAEKFEALFAAPKNQVVTIPESIAPYYYYKSNKGADSTVVSIDIGGGTTDVLIADRGEAKYLTSFRFAANTIFGDGYSYNAESNGFVKKYIDEIIGKLQTNELKDLGDVLKSVYNKRVSTDIIAFLFSLNSNQEIKKKKVDINFGEMLANDNKGKYVVIMFYVAIMYHIAKLMKAKNFNMPRHMTFSGNGSKVLSILCLDNEDNKTLETLTKLIFEEIYGKPYSVDGLEIIRPKDSKESTCKGAFQIQDIKKLSTDNSIENFKEMKTILLGIDGETFAQAQMKYSDISEADLDSVLNEVKEYIEFAFNLDKKFSFHEYFDVDCSIMSPIKELCYRDIRTYLENGLAAKKSDLTGANDDLEETLFFYPIVGIINAIVRNVYKM